MAEGKFDKNAQASKQAEYKQANERAILIGQLDYTQLQLHLTLLIAPQKLI